MTTLSARDAYPMWASTYASETVVSALENITLGELAVDTRNRRLLDVGTGTGRRLDATDASVAVGVDLSAEMIHAGNGGGLLAVADASALPFAAECFDVVWCRLVMGHVAEIGGVFAELARVSAGGCRVAVTDLAPVAHAAGHRRTFVAGDGATVEVEHFVHEVDELVALAEAHGLSLERFRIGVIDHRVRQYYVAANALERYERQRGEELIHALVFARK